MDAFGARVTAQHAAAFACQPGCSSCCYQHLSVLPVEFARLAAAVGALDEEAREALAARLQDVPGRGRDDPRCPLLDDEGACRVYAARPLICRTHGLPIQLPDPVQRPGPTSAPDPTSAPRRDVCPLNFTGSPSLGELPAEDVLDVERLNATLVLIDRLVGGADLLGAGALAGVPVNADGRVDLFDGLASILARLAPHATDAAGPNKRLIGAKDGKR